ncbi:MAG: ScyD/ScyE family protein [Gammaproteobacteria bacterium]|nr:ScyD/ScyE family protein [Gammaproteobacteria bacterium]
MKRVTLLSTALIVATAAAGLSIVPAVAQQPNTFTVYARGLEAPRGLTFGPDGLLYVAEAGTGGTNSTGMACQQVPPPVGPYTGGKTARISKIGSNGARTTVASGFPSTKDSMGDVIGVADVVFLNGTLYALVAGGGCSHGNPDSPNGIAQVNRNTGQWSLIADIGAFLQTHPARYESPDDFEPDGTLYNMIAVGETLYAVEPNHGQVFSVDKGRTIRQVIDISASEGHIVPTSIAERRGSFYVGNLGLFPIDPQWARILTIRKGGGFDDDVVPGFDNDGHGYDIVNSKAGFTTVVAVHFGPDGLLYVLELSTAPGNPAPGNGKVVRVKRSGEIEEVVTGLSVPTAMTFGPDGRLYISNFGAAPAGLGQILRFDIAPGW